MMSWQWIIMFFALYTLVPLERRPLLLAVTNNVASIPALLR
jgi:hypothetical protein